MIKIRASLVALSLSLASVAHGQPAEMPADYKGVIDTLGKQGDFKDGVLKVNIPRGDLKVVVDGIARRASSTCTCTGTAAPRTSRAVSSRWSR